MAMMMMMMTDSWQKELTRFMMAWPWSFPFGSIQISCHSFSKLTFTLSCVPIQHVNTFPNREGHNQRELSVMKGDYLEVTSNHISIFFVFSPQLPNNHVTTMSISIKVLNSEKKWWKARNSEAEVNLLSSSDLRLFTNQHSDGHIFFFVQSQTFSSRLALYLTPSWKAWSTEMPPLIGR